MMFFKRLAFDDSDHFTQDQYFEVTNLPYLMNTCTAFLKMIKYKFFFFL